MAKTEVRALFHLGWLGFVQSYRPGSAASEGSTDTIQVSVDLDQTSRSSRIDHNGHLIRRALHAARVYLNPRAPRTSRLPSMTIDFGSS